MKPSRIDVHHEVAAGARKDQHLIARIGADGLEQLTHRAVILHAQLDRSTLRVRFGEDHAVGASREPVVILEQFPVIIEVRRRVKS